VNYFELSKYFGDSLLFKYKGYPNVIWENKQTLLKKSGRG
jgi:hypothetical protein